MINRLLGEEKEEDGKKIETNEEKTGETINMSKPTNNDNHLFAYSTWINLGGNTAYNQMNIINIYAHTNPKSHHITSVSSFLSQFVQY